VYRVFDKEQNKDLRQRIFNMKDAIDVAKKESVGKEIWICLDKPCDFRMIYKNGQLVVKK
jgi:hypothetical protein